MDTQHNDGGPAFRMPAHTGATGEQPTPICNMSIRDWFAGQYDVSSIKFPDVESAARFLGEEPPDRSNFASLVELSFRLNAKLKYIGADAMLAARKEKQ